MGDNLLDHRVVAVLAAGSGSSRNGLPALLRLGTPLEQAGWALRDSGRGEAVYRSPDRLAQVRLNRHHLTHQAEMTGEEERWLMSGGGSGNRWFATATSLIPEHLVASTHKAIVDPAPVIRHGEDLRRLPPEATIAPVRPTPSNSPRTQAANTRSTTGPRKPSTIPPGPPKPEPGPLTISFPFSRLSTWPTQ
ncbi:DUF317 domain-containing protein [Streptomyces radicis]|uniref:DUF317 domain-containing protein n=1 Tax=Streptomyces radicis TaxID=1750517 RepID=UPI0016031143|nr:DUF317 domain-containing protein [Streptomyces radicis]